MEIINSRVTDLPGVEQENKYLSLTMRGDAKKPIAALENPRQSNAEKQEDLNKALVGTSSAVLQSSVCRINYYYHFEYAWYQLCFG
jgi:hypothetical protein